MGKPAVVTLGFERIDLRRLPELKPPEGMSVETEAVRVPSERQVSWRIRPAAAMSGELECIVEGKKLGKSVTAGQGLAYQWPRWIQSFGAGPWAWIEISYPSRTGPHWLVWFLVGSLLGAICAARKRAVFRT